MKALTLYQPWATLIAISAKRIETRSWSTNYRGPLAIHAGLNRRYVNNNGRECLTSVEPFFSALRRFYGQELPRGCVIATCRLFDVLQVTEHRYPRIEPEFSFGDYSIGRYMWFLDNVKILDVPIPAKGAMGLWEWQEPV